MVSTLDEVLEFINNLGFKRIDEFPEVPSLNMSDTIIVVDNTQHIVGKVNADALMQFLNKNLRNFIMWKPVVTNSTLSWERSNDDTPPESIRFDQILFPIADAEHDGMITSAMYVTLENTDFENIVYKAYLEAQLETKADAIHEHDQYALKDQIPKKLSELENDAEYAKIGDIPIDVSQLNNDANYLTESTLPEASNTTRGTLSSTMFKYISELPQVLNDKSDVGHTHDQYAEKSTIPTSVSQLENDAEYLTKNTLVVPIATSSITGGITIQSDSALVLNGSDINLKHFEVRNMVRNSTFSKVDGSSIDSWLIFPADASVNFQNNNDPAIGYHAKIVAASGLGIYETLDDYGDDISKLTVAFYGRAGEDNTPIDVMIGTSSQTITLTKSWQTYVLHFDNTESSNVFKILISDATDIGTVYITKCHVQAGPIYTGWQPNRNETISSIESIPTASTNVAGVVKVDGVTTVMKDGILHAVFKDTEGRSFASIDDANFSTSTTYSSYKINDLITDIQNTCDQLSATLTGLVSLVNQHTDLITSNSNDINTIKQSVVWDLKYVNGNIEAYNYNGDVIAKFAVGGGGSGTILKKSVIPAEAVSEIDIPTEMADTNNMVVYYNGIMMEENVNYTIDNGVLKAIAFTFAKDSIVTFVGSNVNESININASAEQVTLADPEELFDGAQSVQGGMTVLAKKIKNGSTTGGTIVKKTITFESDGLSEVDIPSEINDDNNLNVYYDGILLTEDINYTRANSKITFIGFTSKAGIVITFVGVSLDTAVNISGYAKDVILQNSDQFGGNNSVQKGMEYLLTKMDTGVKTVSATISSTTWTSNSQDVTIDGVTPTCLVFVEPNYNSQTEYYNCGVVCTSQDTNKLTFKCNAVPTTDITVNVSII